MSDSVKKMKSDKYQGIEKKRKISMIRWIFKLMIISVFLYFVLGENFLPIEFPNERQSKCDTYNEGWYRVKEDGSREPIEIPGSCEAKRKEKVYIENTLPNEIKDNTIIYYLMNKNDLISLNLKYAYDYNNLLSYYLDYKFKHYYDIFNDKNKLNVAFNNLGTYNRVLVNKTKNNNDLKVNKSFKYNNEYYRFNDLFNLDLDLKYLDLDLNDYLKQLDLDLISLDNDLDYLNLLEKKYQYLNDLYLDLDLKYNDLKNDILNYKTNSFRYYHKTVNDLHKNELVLFKREIKKQFNYNTFISNNYNLGAFIFFQLGLDIHIDLVDKQHLNDIDNLNFISNDKKIINQILDIFDFIINRYNNKINNELYNKNYLNIEKLNKHNTKNKNTDLEQIKNGTKNYCYELTNNYFSELNKRYFKII